METHLDGSWRAVRASGIPQRLMTRFFPSVGALAAFHYVYIIVVNCADWGHRAGNLRVPGFSSLPSPCVKGILYGGCYCSLLLMLPAVQPL